MKRRFSQRVEVERKVLGLVNGAIDNSNLAGLSVHALNKWKESCKNLPEEIFSLVEKISVRASLDVNASRDVFSEGELRLDSPVDVYIEQLERRIFQ